MAALGADERKDEKQEENEENIVIARQPAVFVNHGGGPMPYMQLMAQNKEEFGMVSKDHDQTSIIDSCSIIGNLILKHKPSAILIISAHWEEDKPSMIVNEKAKLLYDYFGFPKEAYNLEFNPKCETKLSFELLDIFKKNGFKDVNFVKNRGWDHGVFIPLLCSNVEKKDIPPIMQLSLIGHLNPEVHVRMGTLLNYLRCNKNVMIVGSGMLFHNFAALKSSGGQATSSKEKKSKAFIDWLEGTLLDKNKEGVKNMVSNLIDWSNEEKFKNFGRFCHPREEHLLPLHVVFGSSFTPQEYQFIMKKDVTKDELEKINKITDKFKVDSTRGECFEATIASFVFH